MRHLEIFCDSKQGPFEVGEFLVIQGLDVPVFLRRLDFLDRNAFCELSLNIFDQVDIFFKAWIPYYSVVLEEWSDISYICSPQKSRLLARFVNRSNMSAPFSNVGDVTAALNQDPARRCRRRPRK